VYTVTIRFLLPVAFLLVLAACGSREHEYTTCFQLEVAAGDLIDKQGIIIERFVEDTDRPISSFTRGELLTLRADVHQVQALVIERAELWESHEHLECGAAEAMIADARELERFFRIAVEEIDKLLDDLQ